MQLCIYFLYSVQDEMSVEQQSTPSEEQKETGDRYICKVCYEKFSKLSIEFHYSTSTLL